MIERLRSGDMSFFQNSRIFKLLSRTIRNLFMKLRFYSIVFLTTVHEKITHGRITAQSSFDWRGTSSMLIFHQDHEKKIPFCL